LLKKFDNVTFNGLSEVRSKLVIPMNKLVDTPQVVVNAELARQRARITCLTKDCGFSVDFSRVDKAAKLTH
jgi:hypothetical protein